MAVEQRAGGGMHVQLAEEAAEILLLLRRQVLIPEEDHAVVDERVVDVLERALVERLREIDAVDLGPDVGGELVDAKRCVRHGPSSFAVGAAMARG